MRLTRSEQVWWFRFWQWNNKEIQRWGNMLFNSSCSSENCLCLLMMCGTEIKQRVKNKVWWLLCCWTERVIHGGLKGNWCRWWWNEEDDDIACGFFPLWTFCELFVFSFLCELPFLFSHPLYQKRTTTLQVFVFFLFLFLSLFRLLLPIFIVNKNGVLGGNFGEFEQME